MSTADLAALVSRLESVTTRLEGISSSGGAAPEVTSASLEEYDEVVVNGNFKKFFELSNKLGGEIKEIADLTQKAFVSERQILVLASQHQKPSDDVLAKTLKPLGAAVNEVVSFTEKRRGSKVFNNIKAVAEGIGCLGWVSVSPKPAPYVKESHDQALFYANRVIKEFKGKNDDQVSWARAYTAGILDLQTYVKKNHTTGLVWNKSGTPLSQAPSGGAPPPPAVNTPPPPPPPAVLPPTDAPPKSSAGDGDTARAALFDSLNKGGDITKGLKKVSKDQMTHKNPALRATSVVKEGAIKKAGSAAPKAAVKAVKKPPVCELQGKKWVVEYQEDNPNIKITDTNVKQIVYVYKCVKSTIRVEGKVNSIVLDNCKRVALCFDDVISSAEVINCASIQVQVLGKCQTVSIDKTDGCQVFLNEQCINCDIFSAKSSEMNICVPKGKDDISEFALPEQFKSKWNGKTFVTECSDI